MMSIFNKIKMKLFLIHQNVDIKINSYWYRW